MSEGLPGEPLRDVVCGMPGFQAYPYKYCLDFPRVEGFQFQVCPAVGRSDNDQHLASGEN